MNNVYQLLHENINKNINRIMENYYIENLDKVYLINQTQNKDLLFNFLNKNKYYISYMTLGAKDLLKYIELSNYFSPTQFKILLNYLDKKEYQKLLGRPSDLNLTSYLNIYYHFYYNYIENAEKIINKVSFLNKPLLTFLHFLVKENIKLPQLDKFKTQLRFDQIIRYDLWNLFTEEEITGFSEYIPFIEIDFINEYIKPRVPKNLYQNIDDTISLFEKEDYINHKNKQFNFIISLDTNIDTKINLTLKHIKVNNFKPYKNTIYSYIQKTKDLNEYIQYKKLLKIFNVFQIADCDRTIFSSPLENPTIKDFLAQFN